MHACLSLSEAPLLVGLAVAGLWVDPGRCWRPGAGALHAGDGAVGVELAMLVGSAVTGQASTGVLGVVWLFRAPAHRSSLTRCAAASADADSCAAVPLKPSFLGCVRVLPPAAGLGVRHTDMSINLSFAALTGIQGRVEVPLL